MVGTLSYSDGGSAPDRGEGPGCIVWHELVSSDPEASANFYTSIFDFDSAMSDMGDLKALVFKQGEEMFASILPKPMPEAPDAWVFYVEVKDAQETADLAQKSGGSVLAPPMSPSPHRHRRLACRSDRGRLRHSSALGSRRELGDDSDIDATNRGRDLRLVRHHGGR